MNTAPRVSLPTVHIVQILIRNATDGQVRFLLYPHPVWYRQQNEPWLVFPTDKTVAEPCTPFKTGHSLETYLDELMREELGLAEDEYALEQELPATDVVMPAVHSGQTKRFLLYPVDVWVAPSARLKLCERVQGVWLACAEALAEPRTAPGARAVGSGGLARGGLAAIPHCPVAHARQGSGLQSGSRADSRSRKAGSERQNAL